MIKPVYYESALQPENSGNKFYTFVLCLLPVLNQVQIFGYGFLEYFCIVSSVILLFIKRGRIKINFFLSFYIYMVLSAFMSSLFYGEALLSALLSSVRIVIIFLGIFEGSEEFFNVNFAKKWFIRLVIISSVLLYFQFGMYYLFGKQIYFIPNGITLNYGGGIDSSFLIQRNIRSVNGGYIFRPSSFFIEPAYFAYYSASALIILLFDKNLNRKKLYTALAISIASILTTSTIALISIMFVWLLFILYGKKDLVRKQRYSIVFFIIVLFIALFIVLNQGAVQFSLRRKMSQMLDFGKSSSSSMRLIRGWEYFGNMNPFFKIIGCGFGHLGDYFEISEMEANMSYSINKKSYMNSFTGLLCSLGIVGILFFFRGIIPIMRSKFGIKRYMAVLLMVFMFAGAIMDLGVYYLIIAFMLCNNKWYDPKEGIYGC